MKAVIAAKAEKLTSMIHVLIISEFLTLHIECPTATVGNDVCSFTFDKAFGFGIGAR